MDNILITGGAGFIGANLIRHWSGRGARITVLDHGGAAGWGYLAGLAVEKIEGDIRNAELTTQLVSDKDIVIHLAAQTGVPASITHPARDFEINAAGALNILEACRMAGSRQLRVVIASSNASLGRQRPPATEDKAPLPISPYGAGKLATEGYALAYNASFGVPTMVLRFSNVYGPFSLHKTSVVARFFQSVIDGKPLVVHGDGKQTRDFLYVGDLCGAITAALNTEAIGEIFQIASGTETSINALAELIAVITRQTAEIQTDRKSPGEVGRNFSMVQKAARVLGWRPTTTLDDGLRTTWEYWQRQVKA